MEKIYKQVEHQMGIDWGTDDRCVVVVVEVEDGKIRHQKIFWNSDKAPTESWWSRLRRRFEKLTTGC